MSTAFRVVGSGSSSMTAPLARDNNALFGEYDCTQQNFNDLCKIQFNMLNIVNISMK
jgi:hypothetical protein